MVNWKYKLNLKEDWQKAERKEITAKELADIIVDKIINSNFYCDAKEKYNHQDYELEDIIDELKGMGADDSFDDFDVIWDQFYDWADENKVWVVII